MAYALSVAQISTVKEAINPELIAHAYLLTDSMFGDLGMMVTTDVENIQTCSTARACRLVPILLAT